MVTETSIETYHEVVEPILVPKLRSRIIVELTQGPRSLTELSDAIGKTPSSLTAALSSLRDEGLVGHSGFTINRKGRRVRTWGLVSK